MIRRFVSGLVATAGVAALLPAAAAGQIRARLPKQPIAPAWNKGIQPISRDSYYNAIACGKQGGQNPPCVFWDTDLCRNDDYTLAFYTPYKQVAYEVWRAVRSHQPPPTPNYAAAQRTRIIIGVTPIAGAKNPIDSLVVRRGSRVVKPATESHEGGGGRFIFDFAAFAPTADTTIEMIGRRRTITCLLDRTVLRQLR